MLFNFCFSFTQVKVLLENFLRVIFRLSELIFVFYYFYFVRLSVKLNLFILVVQIFFTLHCENTNWLKLLHISTYIQMISYRLFLHSIPLFTSRKDSPSVILYLYFESFQHMSFIQYGGNLILLFQIVYINSV